MAVTKTGKFLPKSVGIGYSKSAELDYRAAIIKNGGEVGEANIPCGRCHPCRVQHASNWVLRLQHELKDHDSALFLTLTYDSDYLPVGANLRKRDLQLFFHRLRKYWNRKLAKPNRLKFFACGEYGDQGGRPHYHAIVFGLELPDLEPVSKGSKGDPLFSSKAAEDLWSFGRVWVGSVTTASLSYVAGYAAKKLAGEQAFDFEAHIGALSDQQADDPQLVIMRNLAIAVAQREAQRSDHTVDLQTGEITEREPEFLTMSRRPGIGATWFDRYGADAFKGFIAFNGKKHAVPRYYGDRIKRVIEDNAPTSKQAISWRKKRIHRMLEREPVSEKEARRMRAFYVQIQADKRLKALPGL